MKIFWFDTETTGVDSSKNAIVQIAYQVEIRGEIRDQGEIKIQPFEGAEITDEALAVNGLNKADLFDDPYILPAKAYSTLLGVFGRHVDKFNKNDKFHVGGYNVRFDIDMLAAMWRRQGDKYFGSWTNYRSLDALYLCWTCEHQGLLSLPDYKLGTVAAHFGIELNTHEAIADIAATREIYERALALLSGKAI